MTTDRNFLIWIHQRLEHIHGESPLYDYMHKLRAIIRNTPKNKETSNILSENTLEEMVKKLEDNETSKTL